MSHKICMPNYEKSILNISNSILKFYKINNKHKSLNELDKILSNNYNNIVFMVFDGMGTNVLNYHLEENSFLRQHKIMDITSIFPSTTAAATTSMNSGLTPKEHGWLAWQCYFKEYDRYIELFKNTDFYTKEYILPDNIANTILGYEDITEKIKRKTNNEISTYKIFPAFKPGGAKSLNEMFNRVTELCNNQNKKFISVYWDEPDKSMHEKGYTDNDIKKIIYEIEELTKNTIKNLKNTLFIITADHGHIIANEYIAINEIPEINECLIIPPSMEPRVMSFYIKPEKKEIFKEIFNKKFSNDFLLFDKKEYIEKFLGDGEEHYKVNELIGDYVAIAISDKSFIYKISNKKEDLDKGLHAGLTEEEMIVPLIIVDSK